MRVVVADDSVLLREGVTRLLQDAGMEVVDQAEDAEQLVRTVLGHQPDAAIIDIRMPPTSTDDGLRAALEIKQKLPKTGVLILSQYVETGYAPEVDLRLRQRRRLPDQGPGQRHRRVRGRSPARRRWRLGD